MTWYPDGSIARNYYFLCATTGGCINMAHQVLHILGTAEPEGSSMVRIVRTLAEGLDPARYRIHALFLQGPGPLIETLQQAGVPADGLNWWRGLRDPLGAVKFWNRLRGQPYSIVHLHFGGRSVSSLARHATHAKIVRHLHGRILEPQGLEPVFVSARGVDAVVAVSHVVADRVIHGKPRVIYAGLPVPAENHSPLRPHGSDLVLGTAGRLVELKGIEYLIRAAAALRAEFPKLRVEIAGAGPWKSKLLDEIARTGMTDRVDFLGWVDDIGSALNRWDVFVLPSLEEGFPIAALDAMAAGLPVIASAVGGAPELIVDGESGWLVPPRDVEALTLRLRQVLNEPELRLRARSAACTRVRDHFNSKQMAANFARLYDELLGEASTASGASSA
jgi:glycosyltransferase involved in cell wall biosynthesis